MQKPQLQCQAFFNAVMLFIALIKIKSHKKNTNSAEKIEGQIKSESQSSVIGCVFK